MQTTEAMAATVVQECGSCVAELDHCHGTLVTHQDGTAECTEPSCRSIDPAGHILRLECVELADCGCTYIEEVSSFALAS